MALTFLTVLVFYLPSDSGEKVRVQNQSFMVAAFATIHFLSRLGRIGDVVHFDSGVVDCVLLVVGRNYSTNFVGHTIAGQISAVYNDFGVVIRVDHRLCVEYTFQVSLCHTHNSHFSVN